MDDRRPTVIVFDVNETLSDTTASAHSFEGVEDAKKALLGGFARLPLHPDVAKGLTDLAAAGVNRSNEVYPSYFAQAELEESSVTDLARQLA